MRVLVCGGRTYDNRAKLFDVLDGLVPRPTEIVTGDAYGADSLAAEWANERGVDLNVHIAPWREFGRRAGPIRNAGMIATRPGLVVAFRGGAGTADTIRRAKAAGIALMIVDGDDE